MTTPLTPTAAAIDAWRKQSTRDDRGYILDYYNADIRTRSGSWRCIINAWTDVNGQRFYETVTADGSSRDGRRTVVRSDVIAQARGWFHPAPTYGKGGF